MPHGCRVRVAAYKAILDYYEPTILFFECYIFTVLVIFSFPIILIPYSLEFGMGVSKGVAMDSLKYH
jgi:hypothetical protein